MEYLADFNPPLLRLELVQISAHRNFGCTSVSSRDYPKPILCHSGTMIASANHTHEVRSEGFQELSIALCMMTT